MSVDQVYDALFSLLYNSIINIISSLVQDQIWEVYIFSVQLSYLTVVKVFDRLVLVTDICHKQKSTSHHVFCHSFPGVYQH